MDVRLFCPECCAFLGPEASACHCGWERPHEQRLSRAGEALWTAPLGGPARGRAVVADDLVLFAWGQRGQRGGVTAVERSSGQVQWQFETESSVEGGVAVSGDRVVFGTLGLLGGGAAVHCLQLDTGCAVWQRALPAGVWSPPAAMEARVFVGADDGQVHCFDLSNGAIVPRWPRQCAEGRLWLSLARGALIVVSQTGHLSALDPYRAEDLWLCPVRLGSELRSAAVGAQDRVFVGTKSGEVYAVGLRRGEVERLADGLSSIVAAPAYADGVLYVGARDHHLHALEATTGREMWQADCFRTVASSPTVAEGVVYVGANDGRIRAFDARAGELVWEFPVRDCSVVLGSPACAEGAVFVGAENGEAYSLPWHLGRYAWAGAHKENLEQWREAGVCYALAGIWSTPDQREKLYARAMDCWLRSDQPEWAARLRERDISADSQKVAETFEQASQVLAPHKPARAAYLLRLAAEWYVDAEQDALAQRCSRMASRVARAPYLRIQTVNVPAEWEEGEPQSVTLELKNRGNAVAESVRVRFAGNLAASVWLELERMEPDQWAEVQVPLIARASGDLLAEVRYEDPHQNEWATRKVFPIAVRPSTAVVEIEEDVGALHLGALSGKVKVRGSVGLLKVVGQPMP